MSDTATRTPKSRYLLVLVAAPDGTWRPVHGRMEVQGGKVISGSIPLNEVEQWREVLGAARVSLEAHAAAGLAAMTTPQPANAGGGL